MTIDETIKHCLDIADGQDKCADISVSEHAKERIRECATYYRQLAEWLTELKDLREENIVLISECDRLIKEKGELLVKHGRWSECYTDSHHYSGICSVCGKASIKSLTESLYNYCPKCGARMDGDRDA